MKNKDFIGYGCDTKGNIKFDCFGYGSLSKTFIMIFAFCIKNMQTAKKSEFMTLIKSK